MPMDRSLYSADWNELSLKVRGEAGQRCEARMPCGDRCEARNGFWVSRLDTDLETLVCAESGELEPLTQGLVGGVGWRKPIRVVLTVAHLDHDPSNNLRENLQALCQLHHLRLDADQHAESARRTRARKKREREEAQGQGGLFDDD